MTCWKSKVEWKWNLILRMGCRTKSTDCHVKPEAGEKENGMNGVELVCLCNLALVVVLGRALMYYIYAHASHLFSNKHDGMKAQTHLSHHLSHPIYTE